MPSADEWLGYADFVVHVAQLRALEGVQHQLLTMRREQATERLRREHEAELRRFVFEREERLEALQQVAQQTPKLAFWAASFLRQSLGKIGVDPLVFSDFADMDRAKRLRVAVNQFFAERYQQLQAAGEAEEAQECLQFLLDLPDLDAFISARRTGDKLALVRDDLSRKAEAHRSVQRWLRWGAAGTTLAGGLGVMGVTGCLLMDYLQNGVGAVLLSIAVFFVGWIFWLVVEYLGDSAEMAELKSTIAELEKQLPLENTMLQYQTRFCGAKERTLLHLSTMRDEWMRHVLAIIDAEGPNWPGYERFLSP